MPSRAKPPKHSAPVPNEEDVSTLVKALDPIPDPKPTAPAPAAYPEPEDFKQADKYRIAKLNAALRALIVACPKDIIVPNLSAESVRDYYDALAKAHDALD